MCYKFLCISLLLFSPFIIHVKAQTAFVIDATIQKAGNKIVYLEKFNNGRFTIVDSILANNGHFIFKKQLSEPDLYNVRVKDVPGAVQLIWDDNIVITGTADSIWASQVEGSAMTREWAAYQTKYVDPLRMQLVALSQQLNEADQANDSVAFHQVSDRQQKILALDGANALNYIKEYPSSFISLYLLNHYAHRYGTSQTEALLKLLSEHWKSHSKYRSLKDWVNFKNKLQKGMVAPAFTAVDFEGDSVSLSALDGKFVVLDFWGTWCGPCVAVIPELKELVRKYKQQNVELISIACEIGKDKEDMLRKAKRFTHQKEMNWTHILENKENSSMDFSLISKYSIDSYPSIFLIDPEGKILFRGEGNDKMQQLVQVLEEHL